MKDTHSRMQVTCAWCNEVMIPGRGPEKDQISHGCCCECKAKYFPTMADASECQFETEDMEHVGMADGTAPWDVTCHLEYLKCKVCQRETEKETYPCDCGEYRD